MKILVLAATLLVIPMTVSAQTVVESKAQCQMVRFNDEVLKKAKGAFEAQIVKILRQKYGKAATYNISELLQIEPKSDSYDADEATGQRTDNYYLLTISNIRIETVKGNIFTLNTPAVTLRGEEAVWADHFDDEKAPAGKSCSVNFIGGLKGAIINQATQQVVTDLGEQSLSVSTFVIVKSQNKNNL